MTESVSAVARFTIDIPMLEPLGHIGCRFDVWLTAKGERVRMRLDGNHIEEPPAETAGVPPK
jgi:hypothetical protein